MYVIQKEIDSLEKALSSVKNTVRFEKKMEKAVKQVLETKYLKDTTVLKYQKPTEFQYNVLSLPEQMEDAIALIQVFTQEFPDSDEELVTILTALEKRIYTELIKYIVTK